MHMFYMIETWKSDKDEHVEVTPCKSYDEAYNLIADLISMNRNTFAARDSVTYRIFSDPVFQKEIKLKDVGRENKKFPKVKMP